MRAILLFIVAILVALSVSARKQRTGPSRLTPVSEPVEEQVLTDTSLVIFDTIIAPSKSHLRFSGYDKPNRATRETFFVTNNLPDSATVTEIEVEFTYMDMQNRMLHRQSHTIGCEIPPGQTRKLSVRSWDTNNAFHYYRSEPPKRRQSTRYKVSSRVISALIIPR